MKNQYFLLLLAFVVVGSMGIMNAQEVPEGYYKSFISLIILMKEM